MVFGWVGKTCMKEEESSKLIQRQMGLKRAIIEEMGCPLCLFLPLYLCSESPEIECV